jgi:hypothetical protein
MSTHKEIPESAKPWLRDWLISYIEEHDKLTPEQKRELFRRAEKQYQLFLDQEKELGSG